MSDLTTDSPATENQNPAVEPAGGATVTATASPGSGLPGPGPPEGAEPAAEEAVAESPAEQAAEAAEAPAEEVKAEETPEEAPAAAAPAEEAKAEEPKAEEAPVAAAPAEEAKAEEPKAEEAPVAAAPVEEPKTEEAKAEKAPAEEAKAEEPKAEEAPAAAAPVEEPKAEEAKAEKAPAAEGEAEAAPADAGKTSPVSEGEGVLAAAASAALTVVGDDAEPGETMTLLEQALAAKTPVQGQIIGWNKGGYHVAIGKIAAFCPVSQIEIGNPRSPKRYLDKKFPFHIIEIQQDGRRVVVSRAAALEAERKARAALVREHLKPRSVLEGRVSSLTDFGAFVDLGGGIEGLVHVSELSRRRVEHPREAVRKGQQVKVQVLKIEKGGERISLSMKRLEADPWSGLAKRHPSGSEFSGKILRHADFGLFVEVEPGLEGLVHTSRFPLGIDLSHDSLQVGQEISGWVHEVEVKRRRLSLSLREVGRSNPWRGVADRFPEGEIVQGKVEKLTNFGVFIELEPGLTGLLPFALLGGAGNPKRRYHPGKEVSVRVLQIDTQRRRISLGTEASQAEGSTRDYREYQKEQKRSSSGGMTAMEAAFAKLKGRGGGA